MPFQPPSEGKPIPVEEQKTARTRDRKRFFFPLDVQTWTLKGRIPGPYFAPTMVDLPSGGVRMYANDQNFVGIASLVSTDGLNFVRESGLRLQSSFREGDLDCVISHPWALLTPAGVRLYYQANAECSRRGDRPVMPVQKGSAVQNPQRPRPEYRIFSAFSRDGLQFEKDSGIRIDIGEKTGLEQAAHGRSIFLQDGRQRLYFSADFLEKAPTAIHAATSTDGLTWTLDAKPIVTEGHDPAVVVVDGKIFMFLSYKMDVLVLESLDGFRFFPTAWIDFEGAGGEIVGDLDAHVVHAADGTHLYLYGHFKGSHGLGIFERKL